MECSWVNMMIGSKLCLAKKRKLARTKMGGRYLYTEVFGNQKKVLNGRACKQRLGQVTRSFFAGR